MVDDDQMIPTQFGGKWWRNVEFPHLHTGAIYSLVYSADRSFLLSAGEDRTVQLVNPQTSLKITSFKGFHSHVSSNTRFFATGSVDKKIFLIDTQSGTPLSQPLLQHTGAIHGLSFAPDAPDLLVSGGLDRMAYVWDVRDRRRKPVQSLEHATDAVSDVAFGGDAIMTASYDGCLRTYDIRNGILHCDIFSEQRAALTSLEIIRGASSRLVLCASTDDRLFLWDAEQGKAVGIYRGHRHQSWVVRGSSVAPRPRFVVCGSEEPAVYVWPYLKFDEEPTRIPIGTEKNMVCTVVGDPFHDAFAVATLEGHIQIWNWIEE